MSNEVIVSLISSVIGGLLVALLNYIFSKRKTDAETDNLRAEADKFKAESEKIRTETSKLSDEVQSLSSAVRKTNARIAQIDTERILYDGRYGIEGYDLMGAGTGNMNFEGDVLAVHIERNYEIEICKYVTDGEEKEFLPQNEMLTGNRKLRLSCEVASANGTVQAVFFIRGISAERPIERKHIVFSNPEWVKVDMFFRVPKNVSCRLGFSLSPASRPSVVQIRNLVLAERS